MTIGQFLCYEKTLENGRKTHISNFGDYTQPDIHKNSYLKKASSASHFEANSYEIAIINYLNNKYLVPKNTLPLGSYSSVIDIDSPISESESSLLNTQDVSNSSNDTYIFKLNFKKDLELKVIELPTILSNKIESNTSAEKDFNFKNTKKLCQSSCNQNNVTIARNICFDLIRLVEIDTKQIKSPLKKIFPQPNLKNSLDQKISGIYPKNSMRLRAMVLDLIVFSIL